MITCKSTSPCCAHSSGGLVLLVIVLAVLVSSAAVLIETMMLVILVAVFAVLLHKTPRPECRTDPWTPCPCRRTSYLLPSTQRRSQGRDGASQPERVQGYARGARARSSPAFYRSYFLEIYCGYLVSHVA